MLIWIMLFVYIILGLYVLCRILHWLKKVIPFFKHKRMQAVIVMVYVMLALTLIIGGFLPVGQLKTHMIRLGNIWLGTFIYILMNILIVDIIAIVLKLINRKKELPMMKRLWRYYITGIIVVASSVIFSTMGLIHAKQTKLTTYDITVDKKVENLDSLNICMVADLHMGYNTRVKDIEKMVSLINESNADVVVVAGDFFDNNYEAISNPEKMAEILRGIKSKYGVYAVYGNHDVAETLIGGFSISSMKYAFRDPRMNQFLEDSNIKVLEDEVINIASNDIYLIGRKDGEKAGDGTSNRESLENLTKNIDKSKVIIDLEHEPSKLHEVAGYGVDIMLSGHTHAGQFFPLTICQPFAWENYWGLKKIDNMYSIVTSGVGLYGPDMRVFTDSEVVCIHVNFK